MRKELPHRRSYQWGKLLLLALLNLLMAFRHREEGEILNFLCLMAGALLAAGILLRLAGGPDKVKKLGDIFTIFYVFELLWGFCVMELHLGDPLLYPSPVQVTEAMVGEFPRFLDNFAYSMGLFGISFALAMVTALPAGLYLGAKPGARAAWDPYIKVLSLISPIAYIPYVVGIMPSFRAASLFVIYTGAFWPVLKWTIYGCANLDPNYALTSRILGLSKFRHYTRVVIPGIMPAVLTGIGASITGGFTVLVSAEMIGSRKGLGFFIKYFADFLNYHNVVVGIFYLGIAVCIVSWLYEQLQRTVLSWQVNERRRPREISRKIRQAQ